VRLRITTNGLVSAQHAYPTAQRLLGCGVRAATIALNSADPHQYAQLMRPEPSGCGHADVCTFITLCAEVGVQVCWHLALLPHVAR
jgi:molybdenum cofactor biosynthesis enzyme MoaA